MTTQIPGYDYGTPGAAPSPVSLEDLNRLKQSVLFTAEDEASLRKAGEILSGQVEQILDVWYGFVGSHPHLLEHFAARSGEPDAGYLAAVRLRFGQWIRDTCRARFDQDWLNYQHEIALRHTSAKKNRTDGVDAKTTHVPLRYIVALIYPIVATIKPFLARQGHPPEEIERMHQAWFKAVVLQVALWSQPHARDGAF
ncbi:MAG: protogloblin ApPgb [Bryobacteraceae bacterium]|nr:protogloblin ApPgb [Bryobacteraceae bacterium]